MQTTATPNERVLVIDDDVVMRELLSLLLETSTRSVLTAESGEDALSQLGWMTPEQLPAVILTDLKMPGLKESSLAARLRMAAPLPTLLVAMSSSEPKDGAAKGFGSFIRKPFTALEFDAAVEAARSRLSSKTVKKRAQPTGTGPASRVRVKKDGAQQRPVSASSVPALDEGIYSKLLAIMGNEQLPQLYNLFMEDGPKRIERMRSAVTVNDAATFQREAHAIKGGCGMLGATEIHFLASQLETGGLAYSPLLEDFQRAFDRLRRILEERLGGSVEQPVTPNP